MLVVFQNHHGAAVSHEICNRAHIHVGGVPSLEGETRLRVTLDGLAIGDLLLADALDRMAGCWIEITR